MFGVGPMELLLIAVVVLMFYGPDKLPEIMRKLGKVYVQMRRHSEDFRGAFNQMVREAEDEVRLEEVKKIRADLEKLQSPSQMLKDVTTKALSDAETSHSATETPPVDHSIAPDQILDHTPFQEPDHPQSQNQPESSQHQPANIHQPEGTEPHQLNHPIEPPQFSHFENVEKDTTKTKS